MYALRTFLIASLLSVSGQLNNGLDLTLQMGANQAWIWNSANETLQSKQTGKYLTTQAQSDIWARPIADGSQVVLLFNRRTNVVESMTVQWIEIGYSATQSAPVRDLWEHVDLGTFTSNNTSPSINGHDVMMLKLTSTK